MTKGNKIKSHAIIHTAATAAGGVGAGLAQIPCADSIPLSGIQITMIVSLGIVFGMKITESAANAIVMAFAASYAGRAASQVAAGWIPGFGNAMNATTAAALTEAMGWYVARQFDKEKSPDEIISEAKISTKNNPDSTLCDCEQVVLPAIGEKSPDIREPKGAELEISTPIFREEDLEDMIETAEDVATSSAVDKESQDGTLL